MTKHEQRMEAETNVKKRSELANKIEKWKEALTQVADLKGHEANDRPEMELIKEIVDHIRGRLRGPLRNLIEFGLADIKSATENFAETYLIGSGGYGKVYKAELNLIDRNILLGLDGKNQEKIHMNRKTVAIKHILNDEKGQGKQGFYLEIEMLRRCEHPNIVSLLGFCNEYSEMILIYEFASNGSLDDYLGCIKKVTYLNWNKRLKICLDIANGLDYLHTNITDKERIIHRDIKSANILFDENWNAKIADFGLSKFYPLNQLGSNIITNTIAGTNFYLDPEYLRTCKLGKASDIYSLGVVFFEIMCGRLAYDEIYCVENIKGLAAVARKRFKEGTLNKIIDHVFVERVYDFTGPESLEVFAKVAFKCLAKSQDKRPTIKAVIKELRYALILEFRKNHFPSTIASLPKSLKEMKDRFCVKRELYLLKLEEGDDLNDHIDSFDQLVCELSYMDEEIKEEDLTLLMLASLPKSYKLFVQNMRIERTTTLDDVIQKLRNYKLENDTTKPNDVLQMLPDFKPKNDTLNNDGFMDSQKGKRHWSIMLRLFCAHV